MQIISATRDNCSVEVERLMKTCAEHRCTFVFFITSDDMPAHPHIKHFERLYNVVTQDMKSSNVKKVAMRKIADDLRMENLEIRK